MKICGLDEVGRGALAGPLVAAGVVFGEYGENAAMGRLVGSLGDSKQLTPRQRERLYEWILGMGNVVVVESLSVAVINRRGIGWANIEIFRRLISKIEAPKYVVDGNLSIRMRSEQERICSVTGADRRVPEVMAASVVAKVVRDRMMQELHSKFPTYGWDRNKGYGTREHVNSVAIHGQTPHHRKVFVETALQGEWGKRRYRRDETANEHLPAIRVENDGGVGVHTVGSESGMVEFSQ